MAASKASNRAFKHSSIVSACKIRPLPVMASTANKLRDICCKQTVRHLLQANCEGSVWLVCWTHLWVWCWSCSCPKGRRVSATRGCGVLGSTRALQDTPGQCTHTYSGCCWSRGIGGCTCSSAVGGGDRNASSTTPTAKSTAAKQTKTFHSCYASSTSAAQCCCRKIDTWVRVHALSGAWSLDCQDRTLYTVQHCRDVQ